MQNYQKSLTMLNESSEKDKHVIAKIIFLAVIVLYAVMNALPSDANAVQQLSDPKVLLMLKMGQIFFSILFFIMPPLLFAHYVSKQTTSYLKLSGSPDVISTFLIAISIVLAMPLINWMGEINMQMHLPHFLNGLEQWMRKKEDDAAVLTELLLKMDSPASLTFNLFMVALIPALGEELMFRGVVQRIFTEWTKNKHAGIWIAAALFSAVHFQFFGFFPRMLLGAMFGYFFVWSNSLWLPIAAHFMNNASAVILTYLSKQGVINFDPDKIGTENNTTIVIISGVLVAGFIFSIYRREKEIAE